jgi:hypothetical protein
MGNREESYELRRQRLGTALRELAAELVEERHRRLVLAREVRELRTRLAAYEASDSSNQVEHYAQTQRRDARGSVDAIKDQGRTGLGDAA